DLLEAIILGIVQGATEFLPVSSSAHLVLISWWLGYGTPSLLYTVVVHVGTATAVLFYFREEWLTLLKAAWQTLQTRQIDLRHNIEQRLLFLLFLSSLPTAIFGLLLADFFEEQFSKPAVVSISLWITAALLIYGERSGKKDANTELNATEVKSTDAILIGIAQTLAIMPGISRSGSTIAAGLFRGLSRSAATRYSFLLATPIILSAGLKQALDVFTGDVNVTSELSLSLLVGFITSASVGYACIAFLLQYVRQRSLYGFALYCVIFGAISLGAVIVQG
ncbi:MAG: hypothetical protein CUN55_14080, partial [Phototrophicales bacterium]